MEEKLQAIQDIKQDLELHGKCFIAFQERLNPYMEMLVKERIREQSEVTKQNGV